MGINQNIINLVIVRPFEKQKIFTLSQFILNLKFKKNIINTLKFTTKSFI